MGIYVNNIIAPETPHYLSVKPPPPPPPHSGDKICYSIKNPLRSTPCSIAYL